MVSTSGARRRVRDSDDDIETRVFHRPPPFGLDRAMVLQIMRDLEPRLHLRTGARPIVTRAVPVEPNVFLTALPTDPPPPWIHPLERTSKRPRVVRRRSMLPWALGLMSFGLAFGILNDPVVRRDTGAQLKSAALRVYHSSHGAISHVIPK